MGFSGGLVVRNLLASAGPQQTWIQSLGWEDPLQEEMAITPLFLPGKSHRQRSLAGCSPWGHRAGHNLATEEQKNQGPSS